MLSVNSRSRRVVTLALVFALLLGAAVRPQRAHALAITGSVVAATAVVLAAAGVTIWAASNSDATQYIAGQIDDYLSSIGSTGVSYEDWLEISGPSELFDVITGGAMRFSALVGNKLLDFVRWFVDTHGVEADGDKVGDLGGPIELSTYLSPSAQQYGRLSATAVSDDTVSVNFSAWKDYYAGSLNFAVAIPVPSGTRSSTVTALDSVSDCYWGANFSDAVSYGGVSRDIVSGDSVNLSSQVDYRYVLISLQADPGYSTSDAPVPVGGVVRFRVSNADTLVEPDTVVVTPSATVVVPPAVADGSTLDVVPSVNIPAGSSVETATDIIIGGITSEDGLTSEVEDDSGGLVGWGWLQDILGRIESLLEGVDSNTTAQQYGDIEQYELDLTHVFPFCIPWDLHRALTLFSADPIVPALTWAMPLPDGTTYNLNLSLAQFDDLASFVRKVESLLFGVGLALATKRLIKW